MNNPFIEIDAEHFTKPAFEIKPIDGYEAPENFPNCCNFHKSIFEEAKGWFETDPTCNPLKVVQQLSYTEHHISKQIEITDWYKDITDYIEANVWSFGQPTTGFHLYLDKVKQYIIQTKTGLPEDKKQRLIEYIESQLNPVENTQTHSKENAKTDFNILYSTYQKWLKEFPFELNSYFGNLKQHFEKQLPFLSGKPVLNIYLGLAKATLHTESSLIEALINLTKELLNKINVRELVEQDIISDLNKHRFELESERLRIATDEITKDFTKGELQYIKALKKWLQLHKEYFKEITPLLKALPPQPIENNGNVLAITNNFDSIKIIDVYNHFKKGLVEKKYLTESDLISYLKAAFEQMAVPETLFKIKDAPTKFKTMKVFHEYYKNVAGKPHGKQKKYAALLGNYFEGFTTDNVSTNFNK